MTLPVEATPELIVILGYQSTIAWREGTASQAETQQADKREIRNSTSHFSLHLSGLRLYSPASQTLIDLYLPRINRTLRRKMLTRALCPGARLYIHVTIHQRNYLYQSGLDRPGFVRGCNLWKGGAQQRVCAQGHHRDGRTGLARHSDRGSQEAITCRSKYTERRAEAGIEPSVGSVCDAYDNALAETINGRYKAEVIHRRGPWRSHEAIEIATLERADW